MRKIRLRLKTQNASGIGLQKIHVGFEGLARAVLAFQAQVVQKFQPARLDLVQVLAPDDGQG